VKLSVHEQEMLAGRFGPGVQWALGYQVAVGEYFDAERLVPATNAHLVADMEVMGEAGLAFLGQLVEQGARVAIPTTLNAGFTDPAFAQVLHQDESLVARQVVMRERLQALGVLNVDTCINYQSVYQPHVGEHLAWGDTGAVCFANSVLGGRSNFEAGPAALAAGITGRVPAFGYHLDRHRRATTYVEVTTPLEDYADWGALGAWVGRRSPSYWDVPFFDGIGPSLTRSADQLKHLAAALASYGSIALFGARGVTPDWAAMNPDHARQQRTLTVGAKELDEVYASYGADLNTTDVDLVVFSGPQQSLYELARLAELLDGQHVHANTRLIVTTNHAYYQWAQQLGYIQTIEKAGGLVLTGVCFYLMTIDRLQREHGWHTVVTNSTKLANIVGAHPYRPILRRTRDCVAAAVAGRLVG
jgi:hypothetical protein